MRDQVDYNKLYAKSNTNLEILRLIPDIAESGLSSCNNSCVRALACSNLTTVYLDLPWHCCSPFPPILNWSNIYILTVA